MEMDDLLKTTAKKSTNFSISTELKKLNLGGDTAELKSTKAPDNGVGYDDLASLYDVSQAVNSTLILDDILDIVMTRSVKLLNAERGFLMLLDDQDKLQFKTAHNIKKEQLDSKDMKISTTVADMVVKTGEAVYTSDAQVDDRFSQKASIIDLNIRSAMCVPLKIQKNVIGVLYLDNSSQANIFLKQDLKLFEMFAAQAALAIYNARLYTEVLKLQKYQENILVNTPVGIIAVDADNRVTMINEAAENILKRLGWFDGPVGSQDRPITDIVPRNYWGGLRDVLIKAKGMPVEISRLSVEKDGDECVLKIKCCPFINYNSEFSGHVIMLEDITEQVVMEQYLILSEKFIAKGEMAAAIGHELNNYLTAISTNAQLLGLNVDKGNQDNIHNKINVIVENVDHIKRFTDGLMDFSSLESKPVPYDLKRLIDDLVFFVHPQNAFRQVAFDVNISNDLPQVFIDVGQIHQVLLNLFINAADVFSEFKNGIGHIRVDAESIPDRRVIKMCISDDGPGIKPDILLKIFEPHITSKKNGHGFGLWTCQRILKNHGGKVTAYNAPGGGAVFEIILPIAGITNG